LFGFSFSVVGFALAVVLPANTAGRRRTTDSSQGILAEDNGKCKTDNREPTKGRVRSVDRFSIVGCPFYIGGCRLSVSNWQVSVVSVALAFFVLA
jgi:hypothetical protein